MEKFSELKQWIEIGALEKAELLLRSLPKHSPEVQELQKEVRKRLARLCEETVSGFSYLGCYEHTCESSSFRLHEYQHNLTQIDFVLLPPVGITVPFSFQMGSSPEELNRLYHNQNPVLLTADVSDAYLPDDENTHWVILSKKFLIAKNPVSQHTWEQIMRTRPWEELSVSNPHLCPATFISWEDCQEFGQKTQLHLPTEAQWEYACRSLSTSLYYWGQKMSSEYAWYRGNAQEQTSHPPAFRQKKANAFGLYDMSGNICEWCQDTYADYEENNVTDPINLNPGERKVLRGGSFSHYEENLRSAERFVDDSKRRRPDAGFRPAKTL